MSDTKLVELKDETKKDNQLQQMTYMIKTGWPTNKRDTPKECVPFWNFRDELCVSDNIIFKGEKVVIPRKMQSQLLRYIYSSHLSIEKCKQGARDVLFWPGMTSQIEDVREDVVLNCQVCSTYQWSNTKEFMLPHEIPEHPWSQVGANLFLLNGKSWSIITLALSSSICSTQRLVNKLLGVMGITLHC